ncbi:MAG: SDR family NAD(P)-dependent oxidoreductase [Proteobacteria bacterium]|nr:SDR family NAD(P)-dependent oxidoreductase [Pseudomonadota bacterium]
MDASDVQTGQSFSATVLKGQHALVTGGSRGIGAAATEQLAAMGANVSVLSRSAESVTAQQKKLDDAYDVNTFGSAADVSKADDIERSFGEAVEALGPIDILVNNAGTGKSAPFHRTTMELWQEIMDLNLTGTFLCTQQVWGSMRKKGYGRIINIASIVGLRGYPYIAAYCASKHAVVGLTKTLALEAADGITVNAVCPGYTDTDMVAGAIENIVEKTGRSAEETRAEIEAINAGGRMITPQEVAEMVGWLALPSSASVTGQSIAISGGPVAN